jgi:hypothetical protein
MIGPVERAARRDLRRLPADARTSAIAQSILQLAQRLDGRDTCEACEEIHPALSARDEATTVRELRLAMASLTQEGGGDVGSAISELVRRLGTPGRSKVGDTA